MIKFIKNAKVPYINGNKKCSPNFSKPLIIVIFLLAFFISLIPQNAYAVSNYDGAIIDASETQIHIDMNGFTYDFDSLDTAFSVIGNICGSVYGNSIDTTYNGTSGRYLIFKYGNYITFRWNEGASGSLSYTETYSSPRFVIDSSQYGVIIGLDGTGNLTCELSNSSGIAFADPGTPALIYANSYPFTYPSGYEGDLMQNTYIYTSATDVIYRPNFTLSGVGKNFIAEYSGYTTDPSISLPEYENLIWVITDKDSNTDEFSPIGTDILCQVELERQEQFNMSKCDSFNYIDGHQYAVVMGIYLGNAFLDDYEYGDSLYNITYRMSSIDLPLVNISYNIDTETCTNNTISGEYGYGTNCQSVEITYDFFSECLDDEFPYLDFDGCRELISGAINLLSFDTINLGNTWNTGNDCHTLVVLDDWLLLADDYELCPQMPENVRTIITPFITLFVGFLSVGFLIKKDKE